MIDFISHTECQECDLYEQCKSPGMATRYIGNENFSPAPHLLRKWSKLTRVGPPAHTRALLVVGEAPGMDEDVNGYSWLGWAGQLMHRWLTETYALHTLVDIYLSNSCRCRPPAGTSPKDSNSNRCRIWLLEDIQKIVDQYGADNVTILCLGGVATKSVMHTSIRKGVVTNGALRAIRPYTKGAGGKKQTVEIPTPIRCYTTYHPASMSHKRKPENVHAFNAHLKLLTARLAGDIPIPPLPPCSIAPASVGMPGTLAIDIETYGILEGQEQNTFAVKAAEHIDGIPKHKLIVSCALAWHTPEGTESAYYNFQNWKHRKALASALRTASSGDTLCVLTGMNLAFDLSWLRFVDPALAVLLTRERFRIEELSVLNHLVQDTRPEKSLKAIANLFGYGDYGELAVSTLSTGHKAKGGDDPDLLTYNVLDAVCSLRIYDHFIGALPAPEEELIDRAAFRNGLAWTVLHMTETGTKYDVPGLVRIGDILRRRLQRCLLFAAAKGYTLQGQGTIKSRDALVEACIKQAPSLDIDTLELTKKTAKVSANKNNFQMIARCLPRTAPIFPIFRNYSRYMKAATAYTHYWKPLLVGKPEKNEKPFLLPDGTAYSSWFPCPSYAKDDKGKIGGTRQARFAAHKPPVQTFPPMFHDTMISRYTPGVLVSYDLSQIELRVAALLSGDPAMLECFEKNEDMHVLAAKTVHPELEDIPAGPSGAFWKADPVLYWKRKNSRHLNFVMQYRGGPKAYIMTVRVKLGKEMGYDEAIDIIDRYWTRFSTLLKWQDEHVALAGEQGFLMFPTGWKRTFVKSHDLVKSSYVAEIANFLVQTPAAQILQSAQDELLRIRKRDRLCFVMPAQIHDDIAIDSPLRDFHKNDAVVRRVLTNPPLWDTLCKWTKRRIPLLHARSIIDGPPGLR